MKIVKPEIQFLAEAIRAYNHKLRQQILQLLEKEGAMTVTEIFIKLRVEQSVASQHLAILRQADLVYTKPEGKYIYYKVKKNSVKQLENLAQHWSNNTEPQPARPVVNSFQMAVI